MAAIGQNLATRASVGEFRDAAFPFRNSRGGFRPAFLSIPANVAATKLRNRL